MAKALTLLETLLVVFKVLQINCDSEEEALIIFDTLNNRGMQLKNADIFKSCLYKACNANEKDNFIEKWNEILNRMKDLDENKFGIDELFHQYVFFTKKDSVQKDIKAVRSYYLNDFDLAKNRESVENDIATLSEMWFNLEKRRNFPDEILKWYQCLSKGKNDQWMWAVATYYLKLMKQTENKEEQNSMFGKFLKHLTAGVFYRCLQHSGSDSMRTFILGIINKIKETTDLDPEKFVVINNEIMKEDDMQEALKGIACGAKGNNPVNDKAYLFIHAYINEKQKQVLPIETDIEHIFPQSWDKRAKGSGVYGVYEKDMLDSDNRHIVQYFGNKMCLEKLNNIKCSNDFLAKKLEIYEHGCPGDAKSAAVEASKIQDVIAFCFNQRERSKIKWDKEDITLRNNQFTKDLMTFFKNNILFIGQ